ncbi:MAG TPA: AsmA family protein [Pelagibacterium sp.]|uniref:AsmA family protein n=1 Tax=Pelagibacterium sp. TaxID=1967288 RepID=UPI002C16382B|nr:AsmA family protein [Pelagibacterium sp.]HWJ88572.1 AsmA family protein [Pelagibacterium sp.]
MANRIYIAIGLLAILILGGAFIVPAFIDWGAYKGRMEQMAAEALGVEVDIGGDMAFVLLPQPRLQFENARLGPAEAPIGSARLVEADFSLMDFLRDRFTVTQLRLTEPQINLVIDENGDFRTPIALAQTPTPTVSNVSIAHARFEEGSVEVLDLRSGESWRADAFSGDMQLTAIRGPFSLDGRARYNGDTYGIRIGTSAMNDEGRMQVSSFLRPANGAFTVAVDGLVQTAGAPTLTGTLTYRQAPPPDSAAEVGALVLQSPIAADTSSVRLDEFVLLPDENQTITRLTGSGVIGFGAEPSFDIAVAGGQVILQPRPLAEDGMTPFEIVTLLRGMPEPLIPSLPGHIAMAINELVIRGVAVRDVQLDASSDGVLWAVDDFSGRLSGDTTLKVAGTLGRAAGWPAFEGTLSMASTRLDALSQLWKRQEQGNPLFGLSGALDGRIQLINDRLRLTEGVLALGSTTHEVAANMRFGEAPSLDVSADLSALDARQSAALLALLPPIDPAGAFGLSFPNGRLDVRAEAARFNGMALEDLSVQSAWSPGAVVFETVELGAYGGIGFSGTGTVSGTVAEPVIVADGVVTAAPGAPALDLLFGAADSGNPVRRAVLGSLPARLALSLDPPGGDGSQALTLTGMAGEADISLGLEMAGGLAGLGRQQLGISLDAAADSGEVLLGQLGLAPLIAGEDGAIATARLQGNPRGAMDAEISLEGGGERIDFSGALLLSDPGSIRGEGQTSFLLADGAALADLAGAGGVWFPALEGQADIGFVGADSVTLSNIQAFAGDRTLTGNLSYAAQRQSALVSGALAFDALDLDTLAQMMTGAAGALTLSPGLWPDGPIDLGAAVRTTRGRVAITAPRLMAGQHPLVETLAFDFAWSEDDVGLRGLFGEYGGGTVQLDASMCCTSAISDKSVTGRVTLNGVALGSILPEGSSGTLGGSLTLGLQFQGSGDSLRALADSLNGDGSFSVRGVRIEGLSPTAFDAAANAGNLVDIEPETLEILVTTALDSGAFVADEAGGLVSLIGGTARISNIAINGNGARLVGGGGLDVDTGRLGGDWTLALTRVLTGNGLITETTGRIGVGVDGTLFAPARTLDIGPMVDAIQMRAYEIELDELEALRAEQEARQRAAAEEQARMMEEESRRQTELMLQQQQEEAERLQMEAEQQRHLDAIREQLSRSPQPDPEVQAGDGAVLEDEPFSPGPDSSIMVLPPGALQLDLL